MNVYCQMKREVKVLICVLVGNLMCTSLLSITADNYQQYQDISERNAFGLRPPPAITQDKPAPQLPRIILTGITTILGNKRALMKTQPTAAKPGEQAKENSFILTEGQREGDIEVLQIDENAGSVKVNHSGTLMTLTFEKDGAKLPATPPPPPSLPGGAMPPSTPGMAGAVPNVAATSNPGMRPLPTRNLRLPANRGIPSATQSTPGATPVAGGVVPTPTGITQPQEITSEEQSILQQIQRETTPPPAVGTAPAGTIPAGTTPVGSPAANSLPPSPPVLPQ
jgi:hypothetical protein